MNKMTELLAPAGSFDAMKAAFLAGADAVYIGGEKFGARAYADNLDEQKMKEAIDYAHLHGKKLYLTVNTLLKEWELEEELYEYLAPLYEWGLDAVIVQDLGVFSFIREQFPDLPIHCSTQMTITGPESARILEQMGAARIVTARELSLEEIRTIRTQTDLEIESFVHGALCYCYSGQCLFSSMLGGRSGNRGKCAQPCRLPYQVYEKGKRINSDKTSYVLSPKDMCTVELLPEILKAGVCSLKIEGRMKKPEYTAGVVRIYRKYLDRCLDGQWNGVSREDLKELFDLYNRDGFHQGYYQQRNGRSMMALQNEKASGKQKKGMRNEPLFEALREQYVERAHGVPVQIEAVFQKGKRASVTVKGCGETFTETGDPVQEAKNQPVSRKRVQIQLFKTGGTPFAVEDLKLTMDEDIFMAMSELNELRRRALRRLEETAAGRYRRQPVKRLESDSREDLSAEQEYMVCVSAKTREQAEVLLSVPEIRRIYADSRMFEDGDWIRRCKAQGKEPWMMWPAMVREADNERMRKWIVQLDQQGCAGYLVNNPEQYSIVRAAGLAHKAVLNASLSPWNRRGTALFEALGMEGDTVPLELTMAEIRKRKNERSEMIVYGYAPLMISAQCIKKNLDSCRKEHSVLYLKDRYQKEFCVSCSCDFCYNTIYNSVPTNLMGELSKIKKLSVRGFRLCFTIEDRETTKARVTEFLQTYKDNTAWSASYESTRGHFRRGV